LPHTAAVTHATSSTPFHAPCHLPHLGSYYLRRALRRLVLPTTTGCMPGFSSSSSYACRTRQDLLLPFLLSFMPVLWLRTLSVPYFPLLPLRPTLRLYYRFPSPRCWIRLYVHTTYCPGFGLIAFTFVRWWCCAIWVPIPHLFCHSPVPCYQCCTCPDAHILPFVYHLPILPIYHVVVD